MTLLILGWLACAGVTMWVCAVANGELPLTGLFWSLFFGPIGTFCAVLSHGDEIFLWRRK